MSSTPSFIDDGRSFTQRLPPATSLANVPHWLNTTHGSLDTISTYTGSYIDDGLDLLPTSTPGFGPINPRFYAHKKRQNKEGGDGAWNDDIARAVGGDIQASLSKLRNISKVEVKRPETDSREEKRRRDKRKGVVSVPAPLKWGTFVIKGDDGRVIVIDDRGEYDSGCVNREQKVDESEKRDRRWVRATRTPSPPPSTPAFREEDTGARLSDREGKSRRRSSKSKTRNESMREKKHSPKPLTPISESDYLSDDPVKVSSASPTDFFMTGGLSGWPSRAPSPNPPSPIVPHAITWYTSISPPTYDIRSASKSKTKSEQYSRHSLPHGWPSSPVSPTKSVCSSSFTNPKSPSTRKESSRSSRRTHRSKQGSKGHDHKDQEARSNYQSLDIIEVSYDETPPREVSYSLASWGEKAVSARSWSDAHKEGKSEADAWEWVADGTVKSFGHGSAGVDLGWSKADSKLRSVHGWSNDEKQSHDEDNGGGEWDGFEKPKMISEISVAGSASEHSWPGSQHSVRTHLTHRTQRSHTPRRSNRHSPTGWPASQANSKAGGTVHWSGSAIQSEQNWPVSAHGSEHSEQSKHSKHSWTKSEHGSEKSSPTKYQNGFDEDNATYLNDTWVGIPVRVASPHKSVAGWH